MTKVIICAHLKSKRIPQKPFIPINGKPALWWILKRLEDHGFECVLAVPNDEFLEFLEAFREFKNLKFFAGSARNVLERMYYAARENKILHIIRVTVDDLLIDPELIKRMLSEYSKGNHEYACVSSKIDGIGSEIISFNLLEKAYKKYSHLNIEHISYFLKKEIDKKLFFTPIDSPYDLKMRVMLDYPKDHLLFEILSRQCDLLDVKEVLTYLKVHSYLLQISELPKITVYTTCFNGSRYVNQAIESIRKQTFKDYEYYFIDDGSSDDSLKMASQFDDVKILVNNENKGISFSSNRILERAKGKYILRLDSDDILMPRGLYDLYAKIEENPSWSVCYAGYYRTDENLNIEEEILKNEAHHIAGSLVSVAALNELKFKEGLKHWDGQELFLRIKASYNYGYLEKPAFLYRSHGSSWSKRIDNIVLRNKIKIEMNL